MVDISIIIVNYKSWNDLKECLQSIVSINSNRFTMETIVVDNQSNDGRIEEFKTLFPSITFIENFFITPFPRISFDEAKYLMLTDNKDL